MFDSAPPNLPVEPVVPPMSPSVPPPPAASPPPSPSPSVPESPKPMTTTPKKEPEDIFSGLEREAVRPSTLTSVPESPLGGAPWKKIGIILGAVIALVAIVVGLWIFVVAPRMKRKGTSMQQTAAQKPPQTQSSQANVTQVEQPPAIETPPVVITEPPKGVTIPTPVLPPPVFTPTEGRDADNDGLTDVEEPYYDSDSTLSDTNGNGYPDGVEVRNLYNPSKNGGRKLVEAPFISKFAWAGWSFLAPKPWSVVPDVRDAKKAFLVTGTATRFHMELLPNPAKDTIDAWLLKQRLTATQSFKTKAGIDARQTADSLITYLPSDDSVLRVTYDLNGDTTFEFRASYLVMLHSLTR